ncbi:alpha/beta hydrolase [Calidifontibacter sp. DB0510]|uniref:Alpha/beta hydrolase n=1 Tax=Metallococcus carri TaxID=1656884 RepID=A0A967B386_9MICO|nr:alpha/beta hydrolase [Metallococcus carri]NHN57159.1 alpha/beta hydrolase [Metallococcus carri]NOP38038.1 alpha/beta hydrolase [Calidifontibacter sp. DB2511S]
MSTISYSRKGSGQPVVLIHGIGHRRQAWQRVPDMLAQRYDVIAIDLPGFGESPMPQKPANTSVRSYVEQVEDFIRSLDLPTRPHVVGNSLGGMIALELATRDQVASAVALSPAGFWNALELWGVTGPNLIALKASTYAPGPVLKLFADKPALRKLSMRSLYVHPEWLSPEDALGDTLNLRNSKGFWPTFFRAIPLQYNATPKVPTAIGWGEKDRLLLPRQARRAQERLGAPVPVRMLPGCGHVPMLDDPQAVVDLVEETIARAETPAVAAV